jgi:hypothetical protein
LLRDVCTSRLNGVDESLLTQGSYCAPRGGPRDLVCLDQLALCGDTGVRRVLSRQDPTLDDRRDLPVGRHRGEGVDTFDPLSWHMINSRYRRSYSYAGRRSDTCRCRLIRSSSWASIAPPVRPGRPESAIVVVSDGGQRPWSSSSPATGCLEGTPRPPGMVSGRDVSILASLGMNARPYEKGHKGISCLSVSNIAAVGT